MTASTETRKGTRAREGRTRTVVPSPRRSPEERPDREEPQTYDAYPGVRYALEHATALRPGAR